MVDIRYIVPDDVAKDGRDKYGPDVLVDRWGKPYAVVRSSTFDPSA